MPAILRRTRSRSTTRVPFRENPVLADSEVLKQSGDERFVPVPQERTPIDHHDPAREDTPRQGDGRGVQQDDIDRVGAQVTRSDSAGLEANQVRVRRLGHVDRQVDIAARRCATRARAAEQIGELDVLAGVAKRAAEREEPLLDVRRDSRFWCQGSSIGQRP